MNLLKANPVVEYEKSVESRHFVTVAILRLLEDQKPQRFSGVAGDSICQRQADIDNMLQSLVQMDEDCEHFIVRQSRRGQTKRIIYFEISANGL